MYVLRQSPRTIDDGTSLITSDECKLSPELADTYVRLSNDNVLLGHAIVMCSQSTVIATALSSKYVESVTRELDMTHFDPLCVPAAIDYMYTGNITLTSNNVLKLLEIANYYNISKLLDHCIRYISDSISDENLVFIVQLSNDIPSQYLLNAITDYVVSDISKGTTASSAYLSLSFNDITKILSYKKINIVIKLKGYLTYLSHDPFNRTQYWQCVVDNLSDVSHVSNYNRDEIVESFPILKQQLCMLFNTVPAVNNFKPKGPLSKLSETCITYTFTLADKPGELFYFPDTYLHKYPKNYDNVNYVTGIKLFYTINEYARDLLTVSGLELYYDTGIITTFGSGKYVSGDNYDNLRLDTTIDERIIDIDIYAYDNIILSMIIKSNIRTYGPYGSNIDQYNTNHKNYKRLDIDQYSTLPSEFKTRNDCYLLGMYYTYEFKIMELFEANNLVFSWISG